MSGIGLRAGDAESAAQPACERGKTPRRVGLVFGLLAAFAGAPVLAQESPRLLSPTEAYKAALAPYNSTRSQTNDLTDADRFALGIGMADAARDCLALTGGSSFATDAKELFALGQLCMFGQQFEAARSTLVSYLALEKPSQREEALLLLVRALLGLQQPGSAEPQVRSLLRDYPYDAPIHFAIDEVIDDSEGAATYLNDLALQLCDTQMAATLPLLESGKGLEGKNSGAPASVLFADAVRCVALAQASGKPSKPGGLLELAAIANQPSWAGTAEQAPMQAALQRQQMAGSAAPLSSMHGHLPGTTTLIPRTVSLMHGTVVLIPFTLWSPSTPEVAHDLSRFALRQPIYAVTSWQANTGREDVPSSQVLDALRAWQKTLPRGVLILIVPNAELASFHCDAFPAGVLMRNGLVVSNSVLSNHGAERLLVNALSESGEKH